MSTLKAGKIKDLVTNGKHLDGDGLYLIVKNEGRSRNWVFRFRFAGKQREMGLGSYPAVSLEDARSRASKARLQAHDGVNPIVARVAAHAEQVAVEAAASGKRTFAQVAEEYIPARRVKWRTAKTKTHGAEISRSEKQWLASLKTYVYPVLDSKDVSKITLEDCIAVLKPVLGSNWVTGKRVQNRIELILDYATVKHYREGDNPARWKGRLSLIFLKPKASKQSVRHASLPYTQVPQFVAELRKHQCVPALALEFGLLNVSRKNEVRFAEWSEINFDEKAWDIPGKRMKNEEDHRVPLCKRSIEILRALEALRVGDSPWVFPGELKGRGLSDSAVLNFLHDVVNKDRKYVDPKTKQPINQHGLRGTFSTFIREERDYDRELRESCLAHKDPDRAADAYNHGSLFEKRRKVLEDWAKYCRPA